MNILYGGAPRKANPRSEKIAVMVTAEEMEMIDQHRGEQSRSSYGRACILNAIQQNSKWDEPHREDKA